MTRPRAEPARLLAPLSMGLVVGLEPVPAPEAEAVPMAVPDGAVPLYWAEAAAARARKGAMMVVNCILTVCVGFVVLSCGEVVLLLCGVAKWCEVVDPHVLCV